MPELESVWAHSTPDVPRITEVSEYQGERVVAVSATQLGTDFSRSDATRIVADWIDFLSAGPSSITELQLVSRTPKRLFDALRGQTQLRRLFVKWGNYDDLSSLSAMSELQVLRLGGAASVVDVGPLSAVADSLTNLEIESLRRVHDLDPLGSLSRLRQLELGGDWMSSRIAHIDTISWLPQLQDLEHLLLHSLVVDDLDYTPLVQLENLVAVRVNEVTGMQPTYSELQSRLPWAG